MTRAFTAETIVHAPAERVWSALTDWGSAHRWMDGVDGVHVDGPSEPGTTLVVATRGRERRSTIRDVTPGERLVVRSVQGPVSADYRYELTAVDAATTRLRLVADCDVRGPLAVVAPLVRRSLRRADRGQPAALADLVEARERG